MNPNELKTYTFIDDNLSMDVNVSIEKNNIYMKQTEIAALLGIGQSTVSKALQNYNDFQMGQYSKNGKIGIFKRGKKVDYYSLEIIKEIGQKYNPERIQKLEEWLEQIITENNREVIDDNFEIVRYNQDNLDINARIDKLDNTIWMTSKEIAELYATSEENVYYHLGNIFEDEELQKIATTKESLEVGYNGKRYKMTIYNLDIILGVGYRVRSYKAAQFRTWASSYLKRYIYKNAYSGSDQYFYLENKTNNLSKEVENIKDNVKELNDKIDVLMPKNIIYYKDEAFDAYQFLLLIFSSAKSEIFIIDPYADSFTLSVLRMIQENIKITIVTSSKCQIDENQKEIFKRIHPSSTLKILNRNDEHDRQIFIDRKIGYIVGSSTNSLGFYTVHINSVSDKKYIEEIITCYENE